MDSFDTHARIPEHFADVDAGSERERHMWRIISAGWDPGLFSLNRLYANAILPEGKDYTFWGKGVSQGHSDAIRRIDGCQRCQAVHHPGGKRAGSGEKRKESGSDHQTETYQRVLRCG